MTPSLVLGVTRRNQRMTVLALAMRLMPKMRFKTGSWRVTSPCAKRLDSHQYLALTWRSTTLPRNLPFP